MLRLVGGCAFVLVVIIGATTLVPRHSPAAIACTGGGPGGLEEVAQLPLIFIAQASSVGDGLNRAPTATPTNTETATATATGTPWASVPTPVSPPFLPPTPPPYIGPDLTGVGADLVVERVYVGALPAQIRVDEQARIDLEQQVREMETALGISDCTADRFVARYVPGRRYLVFATQPAPGDIETAAIFPIEGDRLVLHDPLLAQTYLDELLMGAETYRLYFSGIETYEGQYGIAAPDVPLSSVLGAVAFLRGDPSIAPPDTGSAGLASGRE